MVEDGQNIALARHALGEARARPHTVRQLECDRAIDEPIVARCKPYRSHAARAKFAHQAIWAHAFASEVARVRRSDNELWQRAEEIARLDLTRVSQQLTQLRFQMIVPSVERDEPRLTIFGRQVERGFEQPAELAPLSSVDFHDVCDFEPLLSGRALRGAGSSAETAHRATRADRRG